MLAAELPLVAQLQEEPEAVLPGQGKHRPDARPRLGGDPGAGRA